MSRAKNIGNLYAELSVKDKMTLGLNKAKKSLTAFARKSAGLAASGSKYAAVAATGTAVALAAGTKGAISMVDAIGDMSAQTGVGVAELMKLQQAYKDGGGNAEDAGKDIAKMQKAIANSKMDGSDPFTSMGLSLEALMNMSPDQQFKTIGDAIMRIENPTLRNAKAMEIFGKSGTKLISVFGSIESSANKLGDMPALAAKFAGAMDEANDIFGRLNTKKDQFFVGFASGIIGELLPNLQKVDEFDFTMLGNNLGKNIAIGFRGLMDGSLLDIAGLKFTAWTIDIGVSIANMINGMITPVVSFIGAAFESLINEAKNAWADIKYGLTGDAEEHDRQIMSRDGQRSFNEAFNDRNFADPIKSKTSSEMKTEADRLWNELSKGMEEGLTEAANIGGLAMRKAGEDVESSMAKPQQQERTFDEIKSEVNSMQARGLGMGPENVDSKVDEQISALKELVKLMKEQNKMKLSAVF